MVLKNGRITTKELADKLGVTDQWIRDLSDRGILNPAETSSGGTRYFDTETALLEYIAYQKDQIDNATDKATKDLIAQQELRFKRARADKMELEIAELSGQLHRTEDVEAITSEIIAGMRSAMLALPGRLAVDAAEAKTASEASAVIKAGVDETLNALAGYKYDPAAYAKRVRERQKWVTVEEQKTAEKEAAKPKAKKKPAAKKPAGSSRGSAKVSGRRKA